LVERRTAKLHPGDGGHGPHLDVCNVHEAALTQNGVQALVQRQQDDGIVGGVAQLRIAERAAPVADLQGLVQRDAQVVLGHVVQAVLVDVGRRRARSDQLRRNLRVEDAHAAGHGQVLGQQKT
jgi:hypothetical protein